MNIATIEVSGTYAMIGRYVTIPAGIVGATVDFRFTDDLWAGLQKTVVFRSSVTRDVLLTGTVAVIPHETVAKPGDTLYVGVYGVDADNNLAIPTLWTGIGGIRDAADPSGDPGTDPTLPIWAQLQQDVEQLKQNGGIPGTPGEPGPEGEDGEDGGYYTPDVTQLDEDTIQFTFTPSKPDMPAANSVTVELPSGQGSGGNAENSGIHIGTDAPTDENINVWIDTDEEAPEPPAGKPGKDGKSAYQYALDGGYTGTEAEFAAKLASESGGAPADWNVAEGEPGHVLNRTHYSEFAEDGVIVPETVVSFTADTDFVGMLQSAIAPVIGNTYKVVWNGVEYIRECSSYVGMPCIGNFVYAGSDFADMDSGEPFFMVYMDGMLMCMTDFMMTATEGSVTVKIVGESIHKIPEKYYVVANYIEVIENEDGTCTTEATKTLMDELYNSRVPLYAKVRTSGRDFTLPLVLREKYTGTTYQYYFSAMFETINMVCLIAESPDVNSVTAEVIRYNFVLSSDA